jgi:hypothetical protein
VDEPFSVLLSASLEAFVVVVATGTTGGLLPSCLDVVEPMNDDADENGRA